jgi:hypothetical protein
VPYYRELIDASEVTSAAFFVCEYNSGAGDRGAAIGCGFPRASFLDEFL